MRRSGHFAGWLPLLVGLIVFILPCHAQQETLADLYTEARSAQASGDLKTATQKYERIVTIRPDLGEVYSNLGSLYLQQRQSERALRCFKEAMKLKPDLAGPYFFLGVMAFNSRRYDEALKYLKRAESLDRSAIETVLYLGYTNFARSSYLNAARDFQKVAEVRPEDPDVLYYLSKAYGQAAKNYFDVLKSRFPDCFYTHLAKGHVYEAQSEWTDAKTEYSSALRQQPGNGRLQQRLAWVTRNAATPHGAGQPPPAVPGSQEELIDGPVRFLYALPDENRVRDELQHYRTMISENATAASPDQIYKLTEGYQILSYLASFLIFKVAPDSFRTHQLTAEHYEELGKADDAIQEYRETAKLKPDLPDIHFVIGNLYWKRNLLDEALPELKQELSINPDHAQALYELGDVQFAKGNVREAEEYLLRSLRVEPTIAEAYLTLERIYTATDRYAESLNQLKQVIKLAPDDPTPHYRMIVIFRKLGELDQAEAEMKIFTKLQSQSTSNSNPRLSSHR
jgi:tetratricopeptide (TPR) repeat protein